MTKDDMEIVSAKVHECLADRVGKNRFELWFSTGVNLRVDGQSLEITAADTFKLERIRRSFTHDLAQAGLTVLGFAPQLKFSVNPLLAGVAAPPTPSALSVLSIVPAEATIPNPAPATPFTQTRRSLARLQDFILGDGNQLAVAGARSAISKPGQVSPLLLYGSTGTGKTHLLEAICQELRQSGRVRNVLLLTAEQFTSQFIEALRGSGLPSFRRKLRDVEVLLIDDVQFFAGKQSTLVELLHTLDVLLRDGRQLIFTADRPPSELRPLGPEVMARLGGGLVCSIEAADYSTRLAILRQLAGRMQLAAPDECLTWMAAQLPGDARQLAGALHRLEATSRAFRQPITIELAQKSLVDLLQATRKAVRLPDIIGAVCEVFGIDEAALQSAGKSPSVSHPRMLAMFLARKYTRAALSEIGRFFNRKSHSTVLSAEGKVSGWIAEGKSLPVAHGSCSVEEALRRVEMQLRLA